MKKLRITLLLLFSIACCGVKATDIQKNSSEYYNGINIYLIDPYGGTDAYYYSDSRPDATCFDARNHTDGNVRIICKDIGGILQKPIDAVAIINNVVSGLKAKGYTPVNRGGTQKAAWVEYRQSNISQIVID
ncbi:MAG: hypothetical protein Pg6B_11280 [Candidatus Azobacteroides pseudotrichonymphae]|nr:MAG: hypothetical protein Pg6B_11280 [Candidatus Azobacteroides pseudotrichonymphae]